MLVVATFYRFVTLESCETIKAEAESIVRRNHIYGTILLAREGINGTVCGSRGAIDTLKQFLYSHPRLKNLIYKESFIEKNPFFRRHLKIKKEIVTLDQPTADPQKHAGTHVSAFQWNELLKDPSVVVIDVRNRYEIALGSFKRAINPNINTFRDFPDFVRRHLSQNIHKKIAMSCTGGIRCEKASSFLLGLGFLNVFQLHGGILKYLEDMPEPESLWQGECFVFDQRVSVNHDRMPGTYSLCFGCRSPVSAQDRKSTLFVEGVACPHCFSSLTDKKRHAKEQRKKQIARAEILGINHLGPDAMPS